MPQLSLLEPCETVLVDDARGRIVYTPEFVSEYEAEHCCLHAFGSRPDAWSTH